MSLQGFRGGAGRLVAPQQLEEHVCGHDRAAVQSEHREDGARLRARDGHRQAVLPDLERTQNPQLHLLKRNHLSIVSTAIQQTVKAG
ncbi:hypothetical protein MPUL_46560 [Mycolicibacterium pulveris]|uniref:Uncharacterized protein n=1 Tax=Mycolicibacterium pulveris TaxID=36813 RepID=A0A7I7UQ21_MYCPV|nr:hypothetical protein [Mycolicibacterium pulveris]BBY83498.1 hypothetical protein MPUL_46560 [Mycolicibacterium pulveris]